ncbi:uncharacterized protein isoform X3 [Rhodnius prolixus]|uniref:uncharacterized protein isoform X3 n=1 Tax=Rhodnius prolixus TaxID=13249 RepID=UPI003D189663
MHRSRSASSSSVRCGCQYYQSHDPLPEKKSLIGTPPQSRTPTMADHEYEPITPKEPPPPPPPILKVTDISEVEKRPATPVPQQRYERKYIKIPNEDAIIIPLHGDSDEEINPDRYVNRELTVQEIQDRMEERFFTNPIEANTEGETSGINQGVQKETQNFQTSIRNQAGRFKNKLRKISTPKISLPERSKIKLPERPKLKLPKRPAIKLPERPKIKLPDRPKIKLPERPKIKLPDKPKFLQEKPKFLTERPKFLTERPKFLSERPKFHLPERPKFHFPDRPKFHLPERFKTDKTKHKSPRPKKPNPSSLRRPLRDVVTVSSQSGSTGNIFNTLKFKTYPRFLSRKKKEKEKTQLSALGTSFETESSLPSTPPSQKKYNPPWIETYRDIKFADDDTTTPEQNKDSRTEIQDEEGYEENTAPFHDSYMPGAVQLQEEPVKAKPESEGSVNDSDKEIHSSGSSSMRHRAGVLEEIDSDEFFLREKGLSREDVDVSRYLSLEIRDAFRSPKNALAKLDAELYDDEYDDEEEEPEIRFDEIPKAPERRKPTKPVQSSKESDFNTFPLRPTRRKQSDPSDFGRKEVFEKIEKPPRKYRSKSDTRQGSMPSLRRSSSHGMDVDVEPPLPPKRRKGSRSLSRSIHESATDFDAADIVHREITAQGRYDIPVAPFRKSRSRGTSVAEEDRTSRGADSTDLPHDDLELQREKEILQETLFQARPVPVEESQITGYAVVMKTRKDKAKPPPRPPPPPIRQRKHKFQTHLHNIKDHSMNFFFTYPRRAIKSLHKPPIRPIRNYSTLGPSRPPRKTRVFREPVYVDSEEPETKEIAHSELQTFADDIADLKEEPEMKDLQSGEVVEKMKGRPLPPPPRPPRKTKDDDTLPRSGRNVEDDEEFIEEETLQETEVEERKQVLLEVAAEDTKTETQEKPSFLKSKGEEFLNSLSKIYPFNSERRKSEAKKEDKSTPQPTIETSQQTSFEITEVSVSIQTDPLPEGYIVEDAHSELEAETASQRSQSTVGDHTRLDHRQSQTLEKDFEETPSLSTSLQERHVSEVDSQQSTKSASTRKEMYSSYESREETPPPLPQRGIPSMYPRSVPVIPVLPEKLHISELDVDKLNVTELQASKVTTQEIDATSLNLSQLSSKSSNLVVNGIELPPDFIQNLAAQIQERMPELHSPQPQLKRMVTPPPSIFVQHAAEVVETPLPQTTQTTDKIPKPKNVRSRGRKSPTRVQDDSEDELATTMPERERRERESSVKRELDRHSPERVPSTSTAEQLPVSETPVITPTAMQLIAQLLVIWHRGILDGASSFMEGVNALFPEGEKRRDAQTAACILLVLIAGLILIGFGIDNSVHHHHWDYVPPR